MVRTQTADMQTECDAFIKQIDVSAPANQELEVIHSEIRKSFPAVSKIAVAIYDNRTDCIKTFAQSTNGLLPISAYSSRLNDSSSLKRIVATGCPRIIADLSSTLDGNKEHARKIYDAGFRSSYTVPFWKHGKLKGFVFFNATQTRAFTEPVTSQLNVYARLIAHMIIKEINVIDALNAATKTLRSVAHFKDDETAGHLERMSRYSRLLAQRSAAKYGLSDDWIEHLFLFAPLHDIGKIAITDGVLLKPGRLTVDEFEYMKTHTTRGREMIEVLIQNFELGNFRHIGMLRSIVELHHETMDGSGYPYGLESDSIPLEARIVAVADIFDALTSKRSYKNAWTTEEAFSKLDSMAKQKLDADLVALLIENRPQVEAIKQTFREDIPAALP